MSEPVIKAVGRWCRECGQTGDHFPRCSHFMAEDEETSRVDVYTRDDLVLVACESRESVWVKFSGDEDATVVFEETPKDVVDRLTKGET